MIKQATELEQNGKVKGRGASQTCKWGWGGFQIFPKLGFECVLDFDLCFHPSFFKNCLLSSKMKWVQKILAF